MHINGVWDQSKELVAGQPVYLMRGEADKRLEYFPGKRQWIITDVDSRGTDHGFAFVPCDPPSPVELCSNPWRVWSDACGECTWDEQRTVTVLLHVPYLLLEPVDLMVSGAAGPLANTVNGVWDRSLEVAADMPVYFKRGSSVTSLQYCLTARQWDMSTAARGGDICHAVIPCAAGVPLESCHGVWQMRAGPDWTRNVSSQSTITVQPHVPYSSTRPVDLLIAGACGSHGHAVNGIWDRSEQEAGGMPVFFKRGDDDMCLEYRRACRQWVISDVSSHRTNNYACMDCEIGIAAENCLNSWQIWSYISSDWKWEIQSIVTVVT